MSGDDRVRHCSECNLNVFNLSGMTRREAEQLIASREGRLCIRFYQRADGTIITRDCPWGVRALARRVSRVAAAAIAALVGVSCVFAQPVLGRKQETNATSSHAGAGVAVTVTDISGAAIPGAEVTLEEEKSKTRFTGVTDANGMLYVAVSTKGYYVASVKHPGFLDYSKNLKLAKTSARIHVRLAPRETELVGVVEIYEPAPSSSKVSTYEGNQLPMAMPPGSRGAVAPMKQ